jgi:ribosome maturation factor RimP
VPASNAELVERVTALAGPVVAAAHADLVEVEVRGSRGSRVVRVIADADDGLDLDLIAEFSRDIGDLLEEEDVVDGRYTLEVSSPGVDRPLRTLRQFRRNVGRDVRVVRTREAIDRGEKGEVTGQLTAAAEDGLVLDVERTGELLVPLADVDHGKVVLPW